MRAQSPTRQERRVARGRNRRPMKGDDQRRRATWSGGRARILSVGLGYDEREGEETGLGGTPHPL